MNIHEAYLRKQAIAVESVHGKGYAKDLLAAADEIKRLEDEQQAAEIEVALLDNLVVAWSMRQSHTLKRLTRDERDEILEASVDLAIFTGRYSEPGKGP
jgi:hypothetical protein